MPFILLLRFSLNPSADVPDLAVVDWNDIWSLSVKHCMEGVVFEGIKRLPQSMMPPREIILKFYARSEQIRKQNHRVNVCCSKVSSKFEEAGFHNCILKGQGLALLYSNPYSRTPGDIDIWLDGGRKSVFGYVKRIFPGETIRYHHIDFPVFKDVPVEVHFVPSYSRCPWHNSRMRGWFRQMSAEQYSHTVCLPDDAGHIPVPTIAFNRIYLLSHIYRHLFSEGIGLRQLADYYLVLRQGISAEDETSERRLLRRLGLLRFAGATMWVMQYVFGLDRKYMIVNPNETEGRFLLEEIMIAGNFGKHDTRLGQTANEGKLRRNLRMTFRNIRFIKHYPLEALCEPVFRMLVAVQKSL